MMQLPEKLRRNLEKIVKEMMLKEDVYGVALFGSWSRYDAESTSDIDLLIVKESDMAEEYVERTAINGLLVDYNFVPKRWIRGPTPPELDQKLYEAQIFYDRDWNLTNTKLLTDKFYRSPERVEMRTKIHIIESDIYLSRATSALSKEDYKSAQLFATIAMENILRIPLEIAIEPFSNSHFIEKTETATKKLGIAKMFNDYLEMAKLNIVEKVTVEEKMRLFKTLWDEMNLTVKHNTQMLEKLHFKVKASLKYYFSPFLIQGTLLRTSSMVNSKKFAEATHYLQRIFLNTLEAYVWLKAAMQKKKMDYTKLMHTLENFEKQNPRNYKNIEKFLNLDDVDKKKATETIEKARRNIIKIREERKRLIKTYISKS